MPDPVDLYIGKKIKKRREDMGMSQKDIAKECGLSHQQIQKYETGTNRVAASRVYQLSKALDVPSHWFFVGLEDHMEEAV